MDDRLMRTALPIRSRELLALALQEYGDQCHRLGCALSDGPDLVPGAVYACGRAALEARRNAESFVLPRTTLRALLTVIDGLREVLPLEEEVERMELFPSRILTLLERRRDPHGQRPGGRRWLDAALRVPRAPVVWHGSGSA